LAFGQTIGDGVATSFNVDHNLGTTDALVGVFRISDGSEVFAEIVRSTVNRVVVTFDFPPATNEYRVVVAV
jgi:hypothetical protein